MNKRFLGVLLFAFVVATGGAFAIYRQLASRAPSAKAAVPTTQVAAAARDLEMGTVLREADVQLVRWPGALPIGASTTLQDVLGRGVVTKIYAKEPIIDSRLAPKGAGGGFAATIPQGMRAFAVRVNDVVGVAGFVTPGMRVDVLISGNPPGGSNAQLGTLSRTLMQNVEVLSAGQDYKKDAEGKPVLTQVVNLLVTPEQAEQLSLAANQTTIQLVLRNPLDRDTAKTPGTALANLFTGAPMARPAPIAGGGVKRRVAQVAPPTVKEVPTPAKVQAPPKMEIILGTKRTEVTFDQEAK